MATTPHPVSKIAAPWKLCVGVCVQVGGVWVGCVCVQVGGVWVGCVCVCLCVCLYVRVCA